MPMPPPRRFGRFVALLLAATSSTACASRSALIRQGEAVVGERWKDLSYLGGSLSRTRPDGGECDLALQGDRIVITAPSTYWRTCPVGDTTIQGGTVTWLGYARGSRAPIPAVPEAAILAAATAGYAAHFVSIGFRDSNGAEGSVTFHFEARAGTVVPLLRSLGRIARSPILVSAQDAVRLPKDLSSTVSPDPLKVLVPGVPIWPSERIALSGKTSGFELTPDGSVVLADRALWSVQTGRLVSRLPSQARGFGTFSPDGRALVFAHSSGAINDRGASQAGELTVFDVPQGTLRNRIGGLPYLSRHVVSADGLTAFAFGLVEPSLSAVALHRGEVTWRSPLPAGAGLTLVHEWSDGVLALGRDWVGVWRGATGERVYGPALVLQDLPLEERPIFIVDAQVMEAPRRLLVLYGSRTGRAFAEIDMTSGKAIRIARGDASTLGHWANRWFSRDRTLLLVGLQDGPVLWNTTTFTVVGELAGQKNIPPQLSASFDASGRRVATAVPYEALGQIHIVIWDISTLSAVGQCLANASDTVRLAPDGRAVLAARGEEIVFCRAPAGDGP